MVASAGKAVGDFIGLMNARGGAHALAHQAKVLKETNPDAFKKCHDHITNSTTNSATSKLNAIAYDFLGCAQVFEFGETVNQLVELPKSAINSAYEKATVEGSLTMGDLQRLFDTVNALSASSSTVAGDASMAL